MWEPMFFGRIQQIRWTSELVRRVHVAAAANPACYSVFYCCDVCGERNSLATVEILLYLKSVNSLYSALKDSVEFRLSPVFSWCCMALCAVTCELRVCGDLRAACVRWPASCVCAVTCELRVCSVWWVRTASYKHFRQVSFLVSSLLCSLRLSEFLFHEGDGDDFLLDEILHMLM